MAREPKKRTSQEKARRAQMSIFARLAGCAYLIYVVVQLLKESGTDDGALSSTMKIVIAVVFLLIAAFIIVITVREAISSWKSGVFNQGSYTDDFEEEEAEYERQAAEILAAKELESAPEDLADEANAEESEFGDEEETETESDGEMEKDDKGE